MRIATVMVTYNRLKLLKEAIKTYENQSILPEVMIIVDNNCTDGTKEYLAEWRKEEQPFEKIVINLPQNIGGSGGFYTGIKEALQHDCEWIWIADDDAFLDAYAFESICKYKEKNPEEYEETVAICSKVIADRDNNLISVSHRRRIYSRFGLPKQKIVDGYEYKKEYFEIGLFTYVGSLIKKEAIVKAGMPQKDFFIYYDDLEHSYRISKLGKMVCVPASVVYHNANAHEMPYGSTWRSFYQSRNSLFFLKWHFPIAYRKMVIKRYLQRLVLKPIGKYQTKNQLDFDAMQAVKRDELGISKKYYIGWKADT